MNAIIAFDYAGFIKCRCFPFFHGSIPAEVCRRDVKNRSLPASADLISASMAENAEKKGWNNGMKCCIMYLKYAKNLGRF